MVTGVQTCALPILRDIIENWNFTDPRTTNTFFFFFLHRTCTNEIDELVEDVINLDINKESMNDNHGHS